MATALQELSNEFDELIIEGFYVPSDSLTVRIADRIDSLETEAMQRLRFKEQSEEADDPSYLRNIHEENRSDSSAELLFQKTLISEELDSCLADASEDPEALSGAKLSIHQVISEGMSDALGLDVEDTLLQELSSEFQEWVDSIGVYTAGWGEIMSTKDGQMYLAAFADTEAEIVEESLTLTHLYPSTKARSADGFLARVAAKLGVG